jgi:hypothetical protein
LSHLRIFAIEMGTDPQSISCRETPKYYGELYKKHNITRAHVIKLGPNTDEAAKEALAAWPGMQLSYFCFASSIFGVM